MRPVIVAANWKMHTTPADAGALAAAIAAATAEPAVERIICPPFVCLAAVRDALVGSGMAVGAQNVHAENAGAYTGEVSAAMLAGLATWAIVGHSERRRDQGETDELVRRKLERCREHGLRPILCVGEQLAEREAGRADDVVRSQLEGALRDSPVVPAGSSGATAQPDAAWLVVAYEPVWAIGTGRAARGADAAEMAGLVRSVLRDLGWAAAADEVPVLYGGSVTSATIGEFLAEPDLDGALVGGASLKVEEMAGIVARAALGARARAAAGVVG
ncbi:MAG TPA: triose-phosphate isomerase [Candidatus Limnocylindrales bacterium]|nr:triose-phosphate isomerase [Candidatus Limnocylindrales bacterium]